MRRTGGGGAAILAGILLLGGWMLCITGRGVVYGPLAVEVEGQMFVVDTSASSDGWWVTVPDARTVHVYPHSFNWSPPYLHSFGEGPKKDINCLDEETLCLAIRHAIEVHGRRE